MVAPDEADVDPTVEDHLGYSRCRQPGQRVIIRPAGGCRLVDTSSVVPHDFTEPLGQLLGLIEEDDDVDDGLLIIRDRPVDDYVDVTGDGPSYRR